MQTLLSRVYESLHHSFTKFAYRTKSCAIITRIYETLGLRKKLLLPWARSSHESALAGQRKLSRATVAVMGMARGRTNRFANFTLTRTSVHDVLSIAESHAGDDDTNMLALAREKVRWPVTFDRDYGELLFARNLAPPPAVILLQVPSYRPDEPAAWLEHLLREPENLLGKFTVFTGKTVRSRPLLQRV